MKKGELRDRVDELLESTQQGAEMPTEMANLINQFLQDPQDPATRRKLRLWILTGKEGD